MAGAPSFYPTAESAFAPEAVLIADGENARSRARSMLLGEGWRIARELDLEADCRPPLGSLVWLELAEAPGERAAQCIARLHEGARAGSYSLAISGAAAWIDLLAALVTEPSVHLLVDAEPAERIAVLAVVQAVQSASMRDSGAEKTEARLKQLSEEVNRIAVALARLSNTPLSPDTVKPMQPGEGPAVSAETIRAIIRARRLRDQFLPGELFADPAWDILLDLLQAEIIQHRVPVSSLCIASAVPATTALRWIRTMTDRGMLLRREDPHDARRVFIELAPATSAALRHYFAKVEALPVI